MNVKGTILHQEWGPPMYAVSSVLELGYQHLTYTAWLMPLGRCGDSIVHVARNFCYKSEEKNQHRYTTFFISSDWPQVIMVNNCGTPYSPHSLKLIMHTYTMHTAQGSLHHQWIRQHYPQKMNNINMGAMWPHPLVQELYRQESSTVHLEFSVQWSCTVHINPTVTHISFL